MKLKDLIPGTVLKHNASGKKYFFLLPCVKNDKTYYYFKKVDADEIIYYTSDDLLELFTIEDSRVTSLAGFREVDMVFSEVAVPPSKIYPGQYFWVFILIEKTWKLFRIQDVQSGVVKLNDDLFVNDTQAVFSLARG